jgi:hypothetical protein
MLQTRYQLVPRFVINGQVTRGIVYIGRDEKETVIGASAMNVALGELSHAGVAYPTLCGKNKAEKTTLFPEFR